MGSVVAEVGSAAAVAVEVAVGLAAAAGSEAAGSAPMAAAEEGLDSAVGLVEAVVTAEVEVGLAEVAARVGRFDRHTRRGN